MLHVKRSFIMKYDMHGVILLNNSTPLLTEELLQNQQNKLRIYKLLWQYSRYRSGILIFLMNDGVVIKYETCTGTNGIYYRMKRWIISPKTALKIHSRYNDILEQHYRYAEPHFSYVMPVCCWRKLPRDYNDL